jgi:DNA-binding NarL/FixJ family response regulator
MREAGENALKRFNGLAATMPDDVFGSHPMLEARLVVAIASILMERPTTANNVISAVERDLSKANDSIRALSRAVRALYVRVETGAEYDDLLTSLQRLHVSKMGGYAKLIEALPLTARPSANTFSSLTPTELRVLASIAHGATSREIANEMGRSSLTIDSHVKSIVRKLGCSGRRAAVAIARENGIV